MFSLVLFSCTKENDAAEFNQKTTDAHKIVYTEDTVPDSGGNIAITMDVDSKSEGVMFYAISNTEIAMPDAYQLISGNVDALYVGKSEVTANNHVVNDTLYGFPKYYVYSVIRDVNDAITPVVIDTVEVNDVTSPYLFSDYSTPMSGGETNLTPVLELVFNEEVSFGDAFQMELTGMILNDGEMPIVNNTVKITKEMVSIQSNIVRIDLSRETLNCGDVNFLTASNTIYKPDNTIIVHSIVAAIHSIFQCQ